MGSNSEKNISRRNFLKASAITVANASAVNALAAEPTQQTSGSKGTDAGASSSNRVVGYCGEGDWLGTAPVIPDVDIAKTVSVDVLVLGGGHAGLMAALGASDKGAKVAVVDKKAEKFFDGYWGRVGEDIGHVNSKWLINRGYGPYDTGEITDEFVKRAVGRCNPDVIRLYVENSGAMFDRMVEIYEEYKDLRKANDSKVEFKYGSPRRPGSDPGGDTSDSSSGGVTAIYDFSNVLSEEMCINQVQKGVDPKDYPIEIGGFKTWPCNAQFMGPTVRQPVANYISVLRWFEKYHVQKTIDQGADWYYGTSAVVLTQDESGAVTGAIVQDAADRYVKIKASKGVILATGDFSGNPEMCWALLNETQEWAERAGTTKEKFGTSATNAGQGHKMACWAGAMIEPSPRCHGGGAGGVAGPWGASPMLLLNSNAKRFCNEAAAPIMRHAISRQPKGNMCLVTDKKFMKSVVLAGLEHGGPNYGRPVYYEDVEEDMGKVLGTGAEGGQVRGCTVAERNWNTVYGADTLEELAGYLGYTGELVKTFVESIKQYNKLCYAGVDSEYGKDAKAMIPVDEAPFYGCRGENRVRGGVMGWTVSGIMTDGKLRALNKEGQPIGGLFVAGNTLGGRYGLSYNTPFAGNCMGMALTHGWLAGKFAAENS